MVANWLPHNQDYKLIAEWLQNNQVYQIVAKGVQWDRIHSITKGDPTSTWWIETQVLLANPYLRWHLHNHIISEMYKWWILMGSTHTTSLGSTKIDWCPASNMHSKFKKKSQIFKERLIIYTTYKRANIFFSKATPLIYTEKLGGVGVDQWSWSWKFRGFHPHRDQYWVLWDIQIL
jgi:hypothetical protein